MAEDGFADDKRLDNLAAAESDVDGTQAFSNCRDSDLVDFSPNHDLTVTKILTEKKLPSRKWALQVAVGLTVMLRNLKKLQQIIRKLGIRLKFHLWMKRSDCIFLAIT